jgi:hypothetical protein
MDPEIIANNLRTGARLRDLVARLGEAELARPVGGGWTITTVLAHIAFWDRRHVLVLQHWDRGELPPTGEPEWYGQVENEALFPEWLVIPPLEAARLAVEAAEAVNAQVARLAERTVEEVMARGDQWRLTRWWHREEHLEQIERGLAQ